ncbi:Ubr1 ubiquitin ligase [Carabus blaptoides fortunei]
MDSTCVLCVDCFKQSEHRNHKYKMGTSNGGGCCDCGDTEAWKRSPFCDIHIAGTSAQSEGRRGLPEDMAERVRVTFDAVLWYAYHLLTLEHSPSIPADLCPKIPEDDLQSIFDMDTYCTVLYNDETHTFEQVINTLTRVIKCNQKVAIEYVTNIDREGRAVVKCSTFQHCSELKAEIKKYTSRHGNKPLKVLVVHAHVVAHQLYAMKLLSWLQIFLAHGEDFRTLFTEVALKAKQTDPSIIEGILLRDIQMWKSARTHWHRLLISGMLMEYDSKKALAKVFTKKYGTVMKEFIRDDHDHSFSVSSLSVQIFTVPTLAHHLIAEEDALFILLNAFISECARKCNKDGKLEFERNVSNGTFKRAQYMLYDLRYLLSAVPDNWTDSLRKGFLQGLSLILNLLTMMQGMDSVSRQVGQHMEYEPEWESAFNLHIKLAYCISLALEWCGTDRIVLVKAYRATMKKLFENPCGGSRATGEVQEVEKHSVACLQYDVASKPVSIHLPLSRFLAGLHLHLENFGLNFHSSEFQTPKPSPEEIIEPVLRTQAMISQVHADLFSSKGLPQFSINLKDMIDHYALATYTRGLGVNQNLTDKRIPLLIWKSSAYTIHTMELLLRDMNKPLLGDLSSRQRDCLESLVRIIGVFGSTWKLNGAMNSHIMKLLYYVLEHPDEGPSVLDWDSLGLLIPLTMSFRSLFSREASVPVPDGRTNDLYIFRLVFMAHIVKILITTNLNELDASMDTDGHDEPAVMNVLRMLNKQLDTVTGHTVWKQVQYACMPFLRCCVLFYRYLTDVQAPAAFTEPAGDTFSNICEYLGVPDTSSELLGYPEFQDLLLVWCSHKRVNDYLSGTALSIVQEPLAVNRLVELPNDYSELINAVSLFTCPNSDREDSRNPTMCLVCGEMLCSQSYCCQIELNKSMVGACTYHAHRCGAGVGIFLRVRECEILFLASPMRGCFVSPPYLDDYGETDQGLRRGNPLHLCAEKYKKLHTLWLSHGIHEDIARAIESSSNIISTQWQHL